MGNPQHSEKSLFPFCAGLCCGMLLSAFLFFPITSRLFFSHLSRNTDTKGNDVEHPDLRGAMLNDDQKEKEYEIKDNRTIPIEVDRDPDPVQSLDWDISIASQRIPAYLSKELLFKKKLFVGIVSFSTLTQRISKLVPSAWGEPWGREHTGDMTFYSSMGYDLPKVDGFNYKSLAGSSRLPDLPSPNMLYQVLRDICAQYIDTHHFYFVGNGNTYISTTDLLNFTMHLNESEVMWIGHGTYRSQKQRYYTNDPDFFCHTGPGFIVSRRTMQGLCPHLDVCEKFYNRDYERPGYELSRCFRRFLNINCTRSPKAHSLFYVSDILPDPFSIPRPFVESLTVNPVVDETMLYVLHQYFIERQLNYTQRRNEYYYSIIQQMDRVLVKEGGMPDDRLVLGRDGNANKYNHPDIVPWERIEKVSEGGKGRPKEIISSATHPKPSRPATGHDTISLKDIREVTKHHYKGNYVQDGEEVSDISTGTVLRRVVPGVGYQYRVDIMKNSKEVASVCINQPYDRVMTYKTRSAPTVKINFILPMQDGSAKFAEFMQMFEQACMSADQPQNVGLLVVLYESSKSNTSEGKPADVKSSDTLNILNVYKQKYPKLSLRWINAASSSFSYMKAVEMAVLALPSETLICSINLDHQMSPEFLHHIRLNTIPYERLFFPVSFQFYMNANPESDSISFETGFWRSFDYSTFCGYKQDIMQACSGDKFESGDDLFQKALQSGLDVFRAPEYALLTKWHDMDCGSKWLDEAEKLVCSFERKQLNMAASGLQRR